MDMLLYKCIYKINPKIDNRKLFRNYIVYHQTTRIFINSLTLNKKLMNEYQFDPEIYQHYN